MDMLHGLGTAVFFGLGWLVGISVGMVVLLFALRPLDVPVTKREGTSWEWLVASFFALLYFGTLGLVLILVLGVVLYANARKQQRNKSDTDGAKKPFLPRVSLAELIAMVLSIGCAPLAFALLYLEPVNATAAIVLPAALLLFPIAFLRAIDRLDGNDVPVSATRTAFIFMFPYMIYSCLFLCARGAIVLLFIVTGETASLDGIETNYLTRLCYRMLFAAALFAMGTVLTHVAKARTQTGGWWTPS